MIIMLSKRHKLRATPAVLAYTHIYMWRSGGQMSILLTPYNIHLRLAHPADGRLHSRKDCNTEAYVLVCCRRQKWATMNPLDFLFVCIPMVVRIHTPSPVRFGVWIRYFLQKSMTANSSSLRSSSIRDHTMPSKNWSRLGVRIFV